MGNSQFPIDVFYNDIRDNPNPNFDKELAYKDLEKVVNYIAKLQKENKELRNSIKSWDENAGNLLKENTKLKKVCHILLYKKINIDFLRESKDVDEYNKWISNLMNYRKLSPEQYELLKEVLEKC